MLIGSNKKNYKQQSEKITIIQNISFYKLYQS